MTRARRTLYAFVLGLVVLGGALAWVTQDSFRLERCMAEAEHRARFQDGLAFALWRLDARVVALLATEASRPPEHYRPYYTPDVAFSNDRKRGVLKKGEVMVPSPLLGAAPEFFRFYFEIDEKGTLVSPQIPGSTAPDAPPVAEAVEGCRVWMVSNAAPPTLWAAGQASQPPAARVELSALPTPVQTEAPNDPAQGDPPGPQAVLEESARQAARQFSHRSATNYNEQNRAALNVAQNVEPDDPKTPPSVGIFEPFWFSAAESSPELFLLRRVRTGTTETIQGIWVDWPKLSASLLAEISAELPGARLEAAALSPGEDDAGRRLASIPVRLVGTPPPAPPIKGLTETRRTLLGAATLVALAVTAMFLLLRAAVDLGERRGRFVSAVTHELRTPLTTFRMYSQMLADGMVTEPEARNEYLRTLERESERLSRIVESVLLYARVEDGRGGAHRERLLAAELLFRVTPALEDRAKRAEVDCEFGALPEAETPCWLEVDVQAVEQILANLVDNAVKYGCKDTKWIALDAAAGPDGFSIEVKDRGPGIPGDERKRLFQPFERAEQHAAAGIPGVGVGLAVARGLARALGGDLEIVDRAGFGAVFRLRLPRVA